MRYQVIVIGTYRDETKCTNRLCDAPIWIGERAVRTKRGVFCNTECAKGDRAIMRQDAIDWAAIEAMQ